MNIFSNVWKKHYKRGEKPTKLVEDLGPLRGKVGVLQYDPVSGQKLGYTEQHNLLVNQSKTNLIRLISQGQSPWIGTIDPTDLAISRMRFGNDASHSSPSRLNYYNFNELSSRANVPLLQAGALTTTFAGGRASQATIAGISVNRESILTADDPSSYTLASSVSKKFIIPKCQDTGGVYANPPSHGTLVVKLYKRTDLINPVEIITFANEVYTRGTDGVAPTSIWTLESQVPKPISTPLTRPTSATVNGAAGHMYDNLTISDTATRLIYDYTTNSRGWKFILAENQANLDEFEVIIFEFEVGKYNVINSVVPREGANIFVTSGDWNTNVAQQAGRFASQDYYSIMSNPEYRDSADDFIDDFSVTFGVNMTGQYGNGETAISRNEYIRYKEAFLFNGLDEMFSAVYLNTSFDKNASSAYYISWTILAPTN